MRSSSKEQTAESRYRLLVEQAPDGIAVTDSTGRCVEVNHALCMMTGYTREELLSLNVSEIVAPEDLAAYPPQSEEARAGKPVRAECRLIRKDGGAVYVEISARLLPDGACQAIIRDVGERKQAEENLRRSAEKYQRLFQYANDSIFVVDVEANRFIDANDIAAKRLGYTRDELLELGPQDIELPVTGGEAGEKNPEIFRTGMLIAEHLHRRKDGATLHVETSSRLIDYGGRKVMLNFTRDVSRRKAMEAAEHDQRMFAEALSETAAIISSTLDLNEVLDRVLEQVTKVVPGECANVLLIEDGFARIVGHKGYAPYVSEEKLLALRLEVADTPSLRAMVETGQPHIVADTRDWSGWRDAPAMRWIRSNVGAPIQAEGRVIGFIHLDSIHPHTFTPIHAERLQAFANQASVAIQNARLFQAVQRYAIDLERQVIQRTAELSETNQILREQIRVRERVEQALAAERNLLRTVIDNIPDSIYVKDREGRFLLVNKATLSRLEAARMEDVIGKTDFDLFSPERAREWHDIEQQVFATGLQYVGDEIRTVDKLGRERWIFGTKAPLYDSEGHVVGLVGINRDVTERKKAERVLAEERNLLRTVIDNLPDQVYAKDVEGRFVMVNAEVVRRLGVSRFDQVIGKTDFDFFPAEIAARFRADEETILQTGVPLVNDEIVDRDATGGKRWMLVNKVPLRDSEGKIVGLVGVNHDITELKRAEEQLHQVVASARCLMWYAVVEEGEEGFKWNLHISNEDAAQKFLPLEILPGQTYTDVWRASRLPEDRVEIKRVSAAALQAGKASYTQEFRCRRADGQIRWLSEDVVVKPLTPGRWSLVGICTDITERKRAEERLQAAYDELERERAQLKALLDAMGEGVTGVIGDEENSVRFVNKAFSDLTGYTVETWDSTLFKPPDMSDDDYLAFRHKVREHIGKHGIWRSELKLRRIDDTWIDVSATATGIKDANGQLIGTVTIIRDISQEKILQEQKARFIANASHELRTPLANIKTRLYLIRRQPDKLDEHLQVIELVADRMKSLIENMLDVSRFERGMIALDPQPLMLQEVVAEVLHVQQPEAQLKNIRLLAEMVDAPLPVMADPQRITQVVTNLVVNAINYTPGGGAVTVGVSLDRQGEDEYALICVQDSGIGIAPDLLPHVFKPFFRANEQTPGTGLGLTIAKEIVDLHGGEITVESRVEGGSRFNIRLPLSKRSP